MDSLLAAAVTTTTMLVTSTINTSDSGNGTNSNSGGLTHDEATSLDYMLICIALVLVMLTAHACHWFNKPWLTETGAIIILGIIFGGLMKLIDYIREQDSTPHKFSFVSTVRFQHDLFINVILPLIILEAGYSLKHGGIVRNLGAVLTLAIAGTLISTLIIGALVFGWSSFTLESLYNSSSGGLFLCLTFGSLLSATDPVSVIALLTSQFDLTKEPPLLFNLVFGESVLNDAVGICLFDVFLRYVTKELTAGSLILAILNFVKILLLSGLIGYVVGLLLAVLFRYVCFHEIHHVETAMSMIFCFFAYYLADLCDLSGIASLFVAARVAGHHASYNMSRTAREVSPFVFKCLAAVAETAVFFLLGTSLWAYEGVLNPGFTCGVILACLASRFFVVFPLCWLCNLKRHIEIITIRMQMFLWYSGLRGAIAFGLVVILHGKAVNGELGGISSEVTSTLLTSTLAVILFTVLIMGAGAAPLLNFLELNKPEDLDAIQLARLKQEDQNMEMEVPMPHLRGLGWLLRNIEHRWIEPFVRRQPKDYVMGDDDGSNASGGGSKSHRHHHMMVDSPSRPIMSGELPPTSSTGGYGTLDPRAGSQQPQNHLPSTAIPTATSGGAGLLSNHQHHHSQAGGRAHSSGAFLPRHHSHAEWGIVNRRSTMAGKSRRGTAAGGGNAAARAALSTGLDSSSSASGAGGPQVSVTRPSEGGASNNANNNHSVTPPQSVAQLGTTQSMGLGVSVSGLPGQQQTSMMMSRNNNYRRSQHGGGGWQDDALALRQSRRSHAPGTTTGAAGTGGAAGGSTAVVLGSNAGGAAGGGSGLPPMQTSPVLSDPMLAGGGGDGWSSSDDDFVEFAPHQREYAFSRLF